MKLKKMDVEKVLGKIREKRPSIDVVRMWFDRKPEISMDYLNSLCGKEAGEYHGNMGYIDSSTGNWIDIYPWTYKLEVFQPSTEALSYLADNQGNSKILINYLELALDFITKDQTDASYLHNFFDVCRIKKWHGKQVTVKISEEKNKEHCPSDDKNVCIDDQEISTDNYGSGTTYSGKRGVRVNNVTYSDRPSKATGSECCHLEVRLKRSEVCKREKLNTVEDLINLNHKDFWRKHLFLQGFNDEEKIKKILEKKLRKLKAYKWTIWENIKNKNSQGDITVQLTNKVFNMILRACSFEISDDVVVTAQNLRELAWFDKIGMKFLNTIPNDSFLP